ncbi:carbon-monoxide dehydrogenase medium subunit [Desulfohalotomaculum tongense]|uniref:FAD binding domain-containing protein n=1 Tax=Desulforadius tongensis TaxID=1216062 RepID=UPI00195E823A|nr:FAD binding domain-containing protein [Desulforadius tongensis]MBM7855967.1 carbon-monoxide dehydrogenase medium subunit [Desulforadius tongensis]
MLKDYVRAQTVDEVLAALQKGDARVIAGGTDLILDLQAEKVSAEILVDINSIDDLQNIELVDGQIRIGAAVTHQQAAESQLVLDSAPVLAEACRSVGSLQIRNTGTVVGNVINAQPAADAAVALVALGAVAEIKTENGTAYQPVEDLYTGVGKSKIDSTKQLVTAVQFPALLPNQGSAFIRLAQRGALALPVLNVAVVASLVNHKVEWVRIVMAPVAPRPLRAVEAENMLRGREVNEQNILEAAKAAAARANPRDSALRGSGQYRKSVLETLVKRGLSEAFNKAQG